MLSKITFGANDFQAPQFSGDVKLRGQPGSMFRMLLYTVGQMWVSGFCNQCRYSAFEIYFTSRYSHPLRLEVITKCCDSHGTSKHESSTETDSRDNRSSNCCSTVGAVTADRNPVKGLFVNCPLKGLFEKDRNPLKRPLKKDRIPLKQVLKKDRSPFQQALTKDRIPLKRP